MQFQRDLGCISVFLIGQVLVTSHVKNIKKNKKPKKTKQKQTHTTIYCLPLSAHQSSTTGTTSRAFTVFGYGLHFSTPHHPLLSLCRPHTNQPSHLHVRAVAKEASDEANKCAFLQPSSHSRDRHDPPHAHSNGLTNKTGDPPHRAARPDSPQKNKKKKKTKTKQQ